jgi:hypothetical protein
MSMAGWVMAQIVRAKCRHTTWSRTGGVCHGQPEKMLENEMLAVQPMMRRSKSGMGGTPAISTLYPHSSRTRLWISSGQMSQCIERQGF